MWGWDRNTGIEAPAGSWERKGATGPFQSRMNFNEGTRSEKTGAFRLGYLLVQTHSNIDFLIGASQQPVFSLQCTSQTQSTCKGWKGPGQVRPRLSCASTSNRCPKAGRSQCCSQSTFKAAYFCCHNGDRATPSTRHHFRRQARGGGETSPRCCGPDKN